MPAESSPFQLDRNRLVFCATKFDKVARIWVWYSYIFYLWKSFRPRKQLPNRLKYGVFFKGKYRYWTSDSITFVKILF